MGKVLFFTSLVIMAWGASSPRAGENCEEQALKEAIAECHRLCPIACKEPTNWTKDQHSVEECNVGCKTACTIRATEKMTNSTPPITIEVLRDFQQRKAACEGKPVEDHPAWESVDPAAANPAP